MLLCPSHQEDLLSAIQGKGLGSLVSDDAHELARRHQRQREAGPTVDSFDPMFDATYNVLENCERLALLNGESLRRLLGCWFCYVQNRYPSKSVYSSWFDAAAEGMVVKYKRLCA